MVNKKVMWVLVAGLSIFILTGCGTSKNTSTNGKKELQNTHTKSPRASSETDDIPDGNDPNVTGRIDGNEIFAKSDLQGSVIEFSDNGCIISPVTTTSDEDGGSTAVIEAEGHENAGAKVNIKYGDNCIFQKAVISVTTGKADVSEAAISDIKKKTSLVIYGEFNNTENFTATKVVIARYGQEG